MFRIDSHPIDTVRVRGAGSVSGCERKRDHVTGVHIAEVENTTHAVACGGIGEFKVLTRACGSAFTFVQADDRSVVGAVDGDGDSDVIKCGLTLSIPSHQNAVLLNDGTGTNFTNSIFQFNDTNNTYDIALGDLDGDNDLDIVFGNQTNYSVWLNVSCHETNDLDNDGIPTKYEIQYGLNPVVNDAMGDNDSDHQNNIDEFIAGKLPVDSNSFFFVAAIVVMSPTQIHFDSVTGRIYSAEYSEALSSIPQAWVEFTNNIPGTGETIVINDSGVSTNRIFRVKVRLNP